MAAPPVPLPHSRPALVAAWLAIPEDSADEPGFAGRVFEALAPLCPPLAEPGARDRFVDGLGRFGTASVDYWKPAHLHPCGHAHGSDRYRAHLLVAWHDALQDTWASGRLPLDVPVGTRLLQFSWRPAGQPTDPGCDMADAYRFVDMVSAVFQEVPGSSGEAGWWETLWAPNHLGTRGRWGFGRGAEQESLWRWGSRRELPGGAFVAERDGDLLPWKAIRLGQPLAAYDPSPKEPRVPALAAGVDVDLPSGAGGRSVLGRFLDGDWGDPGTMTVPEARRHLAEWANGHPDRVTPRCYPFLAGPPAALRGLQAFLSADWERAVLGLPVALLSTHQQRPTMLYDREHAKAALADAGRRLRAIGVTARPLLHLVPCGTPPGWRP